jgi:8-oxo-dGTP pyrophosphatase MutT (NUDIX family)
MADNTPWIPQAAAIPLQRGRVCLVTSSSGKRWVIPKGLIDSGKTAAEMALQEAWEEAGVVGVLRPEPVGTYLYPKYGGTCHVTVYLMDVSEVADDWPERALRQRRWVKASEAAQFIEDEGLKLMFRGLFGGKREVSPVVRGSD